MVHPYDEACAYLLESNESADAKEWIGKSTHYNPRHIWNFDHAQSIEFIERLYIYGAKKVWVLGDVDAITAKRPVDMLLVELPAEQGLRKQLFLMESQFTDEMGAAVDEGQTYVLLRQAGQHAQSVNAQSREEGDAYDELCSKILDMNESCDAREWLNSTSLSLIFEFNEKDTTCIIEELYAMGAIRVFVLGDQESIRGNGSVDMLLIELPQDSEDRVRIFGFQAKVARESGFDATSDDGQNYLLIRWT